MIFRACGSAESGFPSYVMEDVPFLNPAPMKWVPCQVAAAEALKDEQSNGTHVFAFDVEMFLWKAYALGEGASAGSGQLQVGMEGRKYLGGMQLHLSPALLASWLHVTLMFCSHPRAGGLGCDPCEWLLHDEVPSGNPWCSC
jgi:hypothetical protein